MESEAKTTLNPKRHTWSQVAQLPLGVLRARGRDVLSFLQGQLSNDVRLLAAERAQLTGYHNPQGRVIALLRLVRLESDDVIAILPRELIATAMSRLSKFILRSKVRLADESSSWSITGLLAPEAGTASAPVFAGALKRAADAVARVDGALAVCVAEAAPRWLLIAPDTARPALPGCQAAPALLWHSAAIAAGEPQVYATTSEAFVAQMLNLDLLGAIAFEKGCYTGQEVIARAHYRGRVKRRLQRFLSRGALQLETGATGTLADGRTFKVVDAVVRADGRCEFLAVAPLPGAAEAVEPSAADGVTVVEAEALPLPYALPT